MGQAEDQGQQSQPRSRLECSGEQARTQLLAHTGHTHSHSETHAHTIPSLALGRGESNSPEQSLCPLSPRGPLMLGAGACVRRCRLWWVSAHRKAERSAPDPQGLGAWRNVTDSILWASESHGQARDKGETISALSYGKAGCMRGKMRSGQALVNWRPW